MTDKPELKICQRRQTVDSEHIKDLQEVVDGLVSGEYVEYMLVAQRGDKSIVVGHSCKDNAILTIGMLEEMKFSYLNR